MCSAGGPMEFTILDSQDDDLQCNDCGRKFKGTGKKPLCPECQSENITPL